MFVKQQPVVLILFLSFFSLSLYSQNWGDIESGVSVAFNPSQAPLGQGNSKADRLERGRKFAQSQRANNQSHHLSNSYYPHPNVCKQRIINDPYVFEVYHQNHNVHLYINNINDSYLPARIASRILLLESVLPPPYGKKLKKAIKKFTEKCVNSDGDLLEALAHIDERVFRDFLRASSLDVRLFHENIDKIKKYENRQLQGVYRVPKSCFLMNMIEHQAEWKYDTLTKFYQDSPYFGNLLARQLYNHYTKERFESPKNQKYLRQDPLWRSSTSAQRSDPAFQSQLLLRSLYARRLKGSISDTLAFSEEAVNMLYDVVDEQPNLRKMPNGYAESMVDRVIEKCCFEFAHCPDDFKRVFFDASGVLKKYKDDFFVRTHFLSKKLNYKLQQSVNLALIMRDKVAFHEGQAACQEILNKAAGSFYCASPDFAEDYEIEAFGLSCQLVKNEFPALQSVAMNDEKESQLYDLWDVFDGEHKDRARACEETVKTLFEDSTEYNDLPPEVKGFMQAHRLNPYFFSKVLGNQFQHQMTRELIDVIRMAATQKKHGFTADIANFAGLGQDFNLSKQFENTVTAADICWSLLKYGEAVVLGIWDTAESLADITQHPVKYVCDTAAGIGKLAFGILKYGYDFALVPEQARTTEAYLLKMCKDLKKVYDRSTGPECVRFGVHFISEAVVTRRAASGLSKFVGKLARAVKNRPAWDAALAIESVAQDSNSARSFMGDVLYYCEDEFVSTKLGSKYGNATVSGFKHRHKIPNPSSLCKTRTAQLAVVEKDAAKLIGAGTGFTESMAKSAAATVVKSGLTTTRKFLAPSLIQRLLPAVSSVTRDLKNKAIALISILRDRGAQKAVKNFLKTKYDDLSDEAKLEIEHREVIQAMNKLSGILPKCESCLYKAGLVVMKGPQVESFLDGEALTKIRIFHCSCSKLKFIAKKPWIPKIEGGHLSCNGIFQKFGRFKFKVLAEKDGAYLVEFKVGKGRAFKKTIYPDFWDPVVVDCKIREALRDVRTLKSKFRGEKDVVTTLEELMNFGPKRRWIGVGKTNEGLQLEVVLEVKENFIEVVSAYVDEKWIGKG